MVEHKITELMVEPLVDQKAKLTEAERPQKSIPEPLRKWMRRAIHPNYWDDREETLTTLYNNKRAESELAANAWVKGETKDYRKAWLWGLGTKAATAVVAIAAAVARFWRN